MREAACGLVIVESLRMVLCVENKRFGGFTLPGGKLEAGENAYEACRRELEEETGLSTDVADLTLLYRAPHETDENRVVSLFHVGKVYGVVSALTMNVNREGSQVGWLTWPILLERSPFADWYRMLLPNGIRHLVPTAMR